MTTNGERPAFVKQLLLDLRPHAFGFAALVGLQASGITVSKTSLYLAASAYLAVKLLYSVVGDVRAKIASARSRPIKPPAFQTGSAFRFLLTRRAYERLVEQHLVDHIEEWRDAHIANELWLARWIKLRCCLILAWTVCAQLPIDVLLKMWGGAGSRKSSNGE